MERIVASIKRDKEGIWSVSFPEIQGAHTYGRSLSQLRRRIPEVLRLWDKDPRKVEVIEQLELPEALRVAIADTARSRRELERRNQDVQRELSRTIGRLQRQLGLGVRDTGELLGISPQYAHKLRRRAAGSVPSRRRASTSRSPG